MASIGIIANPASGKDIRRLVSYATVIDNNEKVNIVKRIVLTAQGMGVDEVYFMPDSYQMGYKVIEDLTAQKVLKAKCTVLDMKLTASAKDSTVAAEILEDMGVGCVVVLGGDGTSRAVAKAIDKTPIIAVSTGTNNVYPQMIEGSVAGMAAAAIALFEAPYETCVRDKRIEVKVNGEATDIALIDAVISSDVYVGARAIWEAGRIKRIMVTRCHPASIGFSAVMGALRIVTPEDGFGLSSSLSDAGTAVLVPLAAGVMERITVTEPTVHPIGEFMSSRVTENCIVALDGEREVRLLEGDELSLGVTLNGPWRVHVRETLEKALTLGMFKVK